jgi:hypothetical protein
MSTLWHDLPVPGPEMGGEPGLDAEPAGSRALDDGVPLPPRTGRAPDGPVAPRP